MISAICGAIAALLFTLGVIVPDSVTKNSPTFWLLLGLAALSLAIAFLEWGHYRAKR